MARLASSMRFDFYPRPPRGGRHVSWTIGRAEIKFLSTPSARRATLGGVGEQMSMLISIHALREEGDPATSASPCSSKNFYPRPPRGGRPPNGHSPSCTGTISIHALREEGDLESINT